MRAIYHMTDEEVKKEYAEILHFLETCDVDDDGEFIEISEPSEQLDFINEMHDRADALRDRLNQIIPF